MELSLFPDLPPPEELTSPDRRRTRRQAGLITQGAHPLMGRLHPDAVNDPQIRSGGPRCGGCAHLARSGDWFKCGLGPQSHGAGTDLRAWWPACQRWEPA